MVAMNVLTLSPHTTIGLCTFSLFSMANAFKSSASYTSSSRRIPTQLLASDDDTDDKDDVLSDKRKMEMVQLVRFLYNSNSTQAEFGRIHWNDL
jgi:hypothetical protein